MSEKEYTLGENEKLPTKIMVMGVGGGGSNAVTYMLSNNIENVELLCINTDVAHLNKLKVPHKVQIGERIVNGQGVGGNPAIGARSAEDSLEQVIPLLQGVDMLFLTAGMGGGTGTGATPVIAEYAKSKGILTVAVVTTPFKFEAGHRMNIANEGIHRLKPYVDAMIIIHNQNLLSLDKGITIMNAFSEANKVLLQAVSGISDLITKPAVINLDFQDVCSVLRDSDEAVMSRSGACDVSDIESAIKQVVSNPLLEKGRLKSFNRLLINLNVCENFQLDMADKIVNRVQSEFSSDNTNIQVFFGIVYDSDLKNQFTLTVVATAPKAKQIAPIESLPVKEKAENPVSSFDNTETDYTEKPGEILDFKYNPPVNRKPASNQTEDMLINLLKRK